MHRFVIDHQDLSVREVKCSQHRPFQFGVQEDVHAEIVHFPVHRHQRKRHNEGAPPALAWTFGLDRAAVQVDELLRDGQTQSKTAVLSRG